MKPVEQMTMEEWEVALDEDIQAIQDGGDPFTHWSYASPLFGYAGPRASQGITGRSVGCLTMIHSGSHVAFWPNMTAEIRADRRIPNGVIGSYTMSHETLQVFKEWQLKIHERRLQYLHETMEIA